MESSSRSIEKNMHDVVVKRRIVSLPIIKRTSEKPPVKRYIKIKRPHSLSEAILKDLREHYILNDFQYNGETVGYKDINVFNSYLSLSRNSNHASNKTRENIVGAMINNKVPSGYYIIDKWMKMKRAVDAYLKELNKEEKYDTVECVHKSGRKNHYDFLITFYGETQRSFKIEFKFNASSIGKCPQFVQLMKPSQYMSTSYEEYYYDNYLSSLSKSTNLPIPSRDAYLRQIHSTSPKCMKLYQDLYYKGCKKSTKFTGAEKDIEFYNLANNISRESITTFIENKNTMLDINRLSSYLVKSQDGKIYMLYYKGAFKLEYANMDDYSFDSVIKNPSKFNFECLSKTGKKNNVLLRWKNGNGIAYPAFQIS